MLTPLIEDRGLLKAILHLIADRRCHMKIVLRLSSWIYYPVYGYMYRDWIGDELINTFKIDSEVYLIDYWWEI